MPASWLHLLRSGLEKVYYAASDTAGVVPTWVLKFTIIEAQEQRVPLVT